MPATRTLVQLAPVGAVLAVVLSLWSPARGLGPEPGGPAGFVLESPAVANGGTLPVEYTGDGEAATLPLQWSGAPAGTESYAVVMHHVDPEGRTKWYWVLYDIPATVQSLPRNVTGIGTLGNNSVNGQTGYAPPHSKGPGPKTYVYTVYALSAPPQIAVPPSQVSRQVLLDAMDGLVLASAQLEAVYTRNGGTGQGAAQPRGPGQPAPLLQAADASALSVVLGRPTDRSITLNVLSSGAVDAVVECGTAPDRYDHRAQPATLAPNVPIEVALGDLQPDTEYLYRVRSGESVLAEGRFHTQRAPGSAFTFEIQGDSHPERRQQFDAALYARTLSAAAADRPDFYLMIGDDFSVDTLRTLDAASVRSVYLRQRQFLAPLGRTTPVFLVGGNHEQAAACNLDGTANNVAVWAQFYRNAYFAQPAPDDFYTGNATPVEHIGLLRDHYAWTWGDALFVVIDPYWHSPVPVDNVLGQRGKTRDLWQATLGEEQYQWLCRTLETSTARRKFVFAHHVNGTGRGGIEEAGLYEWGGRDQSGAWQFPARRPGWPEPIHQLMVRTGVTIFFQGHDHVFARQELDGVVYQTLPEPADPNYALYNDTAYRSRDVLPNSGRVRVTVTPEETTVEYVRSYLPAAATTEHPDGEVAFRYAIAVGGGR